MNLLSNLFGSPVPVLSADQLNEKLKFGRHPMVLDVCQPDEYRQMHIAGAKLILLNELRHRIKELPKGREIICGCASGNRSRSAARILAKEGYNVSDLTGGMLACRRAGLPVQR